MPFFARAPRDERVRQLLRGVRNAAFTYDDVGWTLRDPRPPVPDGYTLDDYGTELGAGADVWAQAKAALSRIHNYPASFTRIVRLDDDDDGPVSPGTVFATVARHFGFWSAHPCRVHAVIETTDRYGFAFGTLPGHAEAGEERFLLSRDAHGRVAYDVLAISRPLGLARLGAPLARRLQRRFQRETLTEMRASVDGRQPAR
ncbi:MAG: DUF1990 domain-containing protein [Myxococcota bacterium]